MKLAIRPPIALAARDSPLLGADKRNNVGLHDAIDLGDIVEYCLIAETSGPAYR